MIAILITCFSSPRGSLLLRCCQCWPKDPADHTRIPVPSRPQLLHGLLRSLFWYPAWPGDDKYGRYLQSYCSAACFLTAALASCVTFSDNQKPPCVQQSQIRFCHKASTGHICMCLHPLSPMLPRFPQPSCQCGCDAHCSGPGAEACNFCELNAQWEGAYPARRPPDV